MAFIKTVILINICHAIFVCSQFLRSPCPDFFAYNIDNDGQIIGELQVRPFGQIPMVTIRVNFTIATRLSSVSFKTFYVKNIDKYLKYLVWYVTRIILAVFPLLCVAKCD